MRWQGGRHYFVGRHDHVKPPGFLDHANLDNYHLTVGSWFGTGGFAICYGESNSNVLNFQAILNFITILFTILLVGFLLLIAVIISMGILNRASEQ